jgi:hypothetical protein
VLIQDAKAIYYGSTELEKAILNNNVVWGKTYLRSRNVLTSEGFSTGTSITKDGFSSSYTTRAANLPGNSDIVNVVRSYWQDWGDDIFDSWGFFYLYDPEFQNYRGIVLNDANFNAADGVISTQTFTFNSRVFTFKYGYPVQGIFKFDISVNDNKTFHFGFDGNLGSNGFTVNNLLAHDYTLNGETFKLHYNNNFQSNLPSESFFTYFVPYEKEKNKTASPYVRKLYNIDNLALYTVALKKGVNIYISKQVDVRDWVINDLEFNFF